MRDYSSTPILDWQTRGSLNKARFQILHQEPVALQMPEDFDMGLSTEDLGSNVNEKDGVVYNCDGTTAMQLLAVKNRSQDLDALAKACHAASFRVDIDTAQHRFIFHD